MAAPATLSVFNTLRQQDGTPVVGATVYCVFAYNQATVTATGDAFTPQQQSAVTDSTGKYTFTVVGNDLLSPTNTVYDIIEPSRRYQIAPQSTNGNSQQTTAVNVIVNTPGALAAATQNVTGPLTVAGLLTAQAGETVTGPFTLTGASAYEDLTQILTPGAPGVGVTRLYAKTDGRLYRLNAGNLEVPLDDLMVFNVRDYGAKGDGATDDTTAIQAAINAAKVNGGVVFFPLAANGTAGIYNFTSLNLDQTYGVVLEGVTSVTSGSGLPSRLVCTLGAGVGNAIKATSTQGFVARNLYITNSNAAFNGYLIDLSKTGALASQLFLIENCFLNMGVNAFGVNMDTTDDGTVRECFFNGGGALRGGAVSWSSIQIRSCRFSNAAATPIVAATGQGILIDSCSFEPLSGGLAGAINITGVNALTIYGCWFGDATGGAANWINITGGALVVSGCYISLSASATGINIPGASNLGIYVFGNSFATLSVGVAIGAAVNNGVHIFANTWSSVTTRVSGTPLTGMVEGSSSLAGSIGAPQLYTSYRARAFLTAAQSIATATLTKMLLDTKTGTGGYDPNGNFDAVTNHRYVAPVTGYYKVVARAEFASSVAGFLGPLIYINGVPNNATRGAMGTLQAAQSEDVIFLNVGDYIEAWIQQSSGGSVALAVPLPGGCFLAVHYLSS